jgi:hypothetical protein
VGKFAAAFHSGAAFPFFGKWRADSLAGTQRLTTHYPCADRFAADACGDDCSTCVCCNASLQIGKTIGGRRYSDTGALEIS